MSPTHTGASGRPRRLLLLMALVTLVASPAVAQQNTLDTDSFGGTNGNALSTYNAKWSAGASCCNEAAIRGTPGVGTTGSSIDKNTGQTWTNDHWAELKVDGTTVATIVFAVCVRFTGDSGTAGNGYCAGKDAGTFGNRVDIWKVVANARTSLINDVPVLATNDVVNLQAVGSVLTLRVNGSVVLTVTDTSCAGSACFPTGGNPGLNLEHANNVDRLGGTWKAGSVGGTATIAPTLLPLLGVGGPGDD